MSVLDGAIAAWARMLADPAMRENLVQLKSLIWLIENGAASLYISAQATEPRRQVHFRVTFADGNYAHGVGDDIVTAAKDALERAKHIGPLANG